MALTEAQKAAARRRYAKMKQFAVTGGYVPQKKEGTGQSIKKVSKKGTTYYYTPWSLLSEEQKAKRIAQSKKYAAETRAMARAYKEQHGLT